MIDEIFARKRKNILSYSNPITEISVLFAQY